MHLPNEPGTTRLACVIRLLHSGMFPGTKRSVKPTRHNGPSRCRKTNMAMQVGLITYGTHVHVHELGFTECAKSYVFRGSKEYTPASVAEQLGLAGRAVRGPPGAPQQVAGVDVILACLPIACRGQS